MIIAVQRNNIVDAWRDAEAFVDRGLKHTRGEMDKYDILSALLNTELQLWLAMSEDNRVIGIVLTTLNVGPQKKTCKIVLMVGGAFGDGWFKESLEVIEDYATKMGCHEIEEYGRAGWEKIGPSVGWKKGYVVMYKELGNLVSIERGKAHG